ncbi:hypothetical protein ACFL31_01675, partial [Candidatus Margulisiibacteriota bacterium]
ENIDDSFITHLAFYYALLNIFKRSSKLETVIHPFEGQPWEKMLRIAVQTIRPNIRVAGYQHSSFAPFDLNYFLGPGEEDYSPLPDFLMANSDYNRKRLIEGGFSPARAINIGSLRYSYLLNSNNSYDKAEQKRNSLLVCLPYDITIASNMIDDLAPSMTKLKKNQVISNIQIKSHPLAPYDPPEGSAKTELIEMMAQKVQGRLKEALETADILLYCNGTVSIEGVYLNKKLIKYLPELDLDLDPLAYLEKDLFIKVGCGEELESAVISLLSNNNGLNHNKNMFDPVDYNKINELILMRKDVKQ